MFDAESVCHVKASRVCDARRCWRRTRGLGACTKNESAGTGTNTLLRVLTAPCGSTSFVNGSTARRQRPHGRRRRTSGRPCSSCNCAPGCATRTAYRSSTVSTRGYSSSCTVSVSRGAVRAATSGGAHRAKENRPARPCAGRPGSQELQLPGARIGPRSAKRAARLHRRGDAHVPLARLEVATSAALLARWRKNSRANVRQ